MKVVLAGGSGALGRRVAADLAARGDDVVILTRTRRPDVPHRQVLWDGATVGPWAGELGGAALVNLAGELVDRRPTPANIEILTRSRVQPTRALALAAGGLDGAPAVWVQMSTLAIYGDRGDAVLDERAAPAEEPPQMAGVARAWEAAAVDAVADRQVVLRTGIVLARSTPAFDRLTTLVRRGLGGRVGTGRQWISWLHIDDYLAIIRLMMDDPTLSGLYHVTGPNPVRNVEFMAELRRVLHRPTSPPTPAFLVPLGARLMRTDPALALTGRRCVPLRLEEAHFPFAYPTLGPALSDLTRAPLGGE